MKANLPFPLISCICISHNGPEFLLRTILLFAEQTYTNKELIVSYRNNDIDSEDLIKKAATFSGLSIFGLVHDDETLGTARNRTIINARGEFICIWDDDDLYHKNRITDQYKVISEYHQQHDAAILTRIIFYHSYEQTAYLSFPSYWAGTLLCRKNHFLQYPCEDSNEFEFKTILRFLLVNKLLISIESESMLYTFIFHGKNLMKYSVFLHLINRSEPLQAEITENIKAYLNKTLLLNNSPSNHYGTNGRV